MIEQCEYRKSLTLLSYESYGGNHFPNHQSHNWDHTMRKREKYVVKKQVGMGNKNVNSKKFYLI